MPRKSYMPTTKEGIAQMLAAFYINMIANTKALATKYIVTDDELSQVQQAMIVWSWFMQATTAGKHWSLSLNNAWGRMEAGAPQPAIPVPGGPMMPPDPTFRRRLRRPRSSTPGSWLSSRRWWRGSRMRRITM